MIAAVMGRITEAAVVDQAKAIPMMVLATGENTTKDRVAVMVPVAVAVDVVTIKEMALVVGTTKDAA